MSGATTEDSYVARSFMTQAVKNRLGDFRDRFAASIRLDGNFGEDYQDVGLSFRQVDDAGIVAGGRNLACLVRHAGVRGEKRRDHGIEPLLQKNFDGQVAARFREE